MPDLMAIARDVKEKAARSMKRANQQDYKTVGNMFYTKVNRPTVGAHPYPQQHSHQLPYQPPRQQQYRPPVTTYAAPYAAQKPPGTGGGMTAALHNQNAWEQYQQQQPFKAWHGQKFRRI